MISGVVTKRGLIERFLTPGLWSQGPWQASDSSEKVDIHLTVQKGQEESAHVMVLPQPPWQPGQLSKMVSKQKLNKD